MAKYLVTGAAGFIAHRVCQMLLEAGHTVVGVDNMNDGYDARLKKWHLAQIVPFKKFTFNKQNICNMAALQDLMTEHQHFDAVINLAARAGVRSSTVTPGGIFQYQPDGHIEPVGVVPRARHPQVRAGFLIQRVRQ